MKMTQRARRAGMAVMTVAAIGGGVAVGAVTATSTAATTPAQAGTSGARTSYADVVHQVLPSVVLISTGDGLGSGVVLDTAGDIVTNAHVAGHASTFKVQIPGDSTPRTASLVGSYQPDDLAVIRVNDAAGLRPATFGDSAKAQAGDVVLAVGNPLGLSGSVTSGIISATGRVVTEPATETTAGAVLPDAIQTSAPINPGNSGGALVTTNGEVIGIPTLAAASQGGSQAQGIGFAIPSNLARDISHQLITSGTVTNPHRAAIGAQVGTVTGPDGGPAGTSIVAITSGGPAEHANLRPGDIIRDAAGTPTPDAQALAGVLAGAHPGDQITLSVVRGAHELTIKVTLGELPGS